MKTTYLKSKAIKQFIKEAGKQVSPEFLAALDKAVYVKLIEISRDNKDKRLRAIHVEVTF